MEGVIKYLQSEASKYNDLTNIMKKLQDQGYIDELYAVIRKIFDHEVQFTLQGFFFPTISKHTIRIDKIFNSSHPPRQVQSKLPIRTQQIHFQIQLPSHHLNAR